MKYLMIFEKGPKSIGAYVPDLPGCVAVGKTQRDVRRLIREAIDLHLEDMRERGEPIAKPSTQSEMIEPAAA